MKGIMECQSKECKGRETVQEWIGMGSLRKMGIMFKFHCTQCEEIQEYYPESDIYGLPHFEIRWLSAKEE